MQVITAPVVSFVDFIVNQVIVGMLLWPKRITVPILSWNGVLPANDADVDLEVERLSGRQQGVVRVSVLQAKELKAYDAMGECGRARDSRGGREGKMQACVSGGISADSTSASACLPAGQPAESHNPCLFASRAIVFMLAGRYNRFSVSVTAVSFDFCPFPSPPFAQHPFSPILGVT